MSNRHQHSSGFSLAETTIILGVLSVLSASITPTISDYVSQARTVRARSDAQTIATSLARFVFDTTGQRERRGGWATLDLLVGNGATPTKAEEGDAGWLGERDDVTVGLLDRHLVTNDTAYTTPSASSASHLGPGGGWRGPYLEAGVGSDPWGARYAVNIKALARPTGVSAIVLSAGPNGAIETSLGISGAVGGDDVISLIGGGW